MIFLSNSKRFRKRAKETQVKRFRETGKGAEVKIFSPMVNDAIEELNMV